MNWLNRKGKLKNKLQDWTNALHKPRFNLRRGNPMKLLIMLSVGIGTNFSSSNNCCKKTRFPCLKECRQTRSPFENIRIDFPEPTYPDPGQS